LQREKEAADKAEQIQKLKIEVETEKNILSQELADFSSIAILENLFGVTHPEGILKFYTVCKNEQGKDPKAVYLDEVWQRGIFKWLGAKIALSWLGLPEIINSILNPPKGSEGGLSSLTKSILSYLSGPHNARNELIGFIKATTSYLTQLRQITSDFANRENLTSDEQNLSLEVLIEKRLGVNQLGLIFEGFNNFLSKTVNYKSNIPWYKGGFVAEWIKDKIVNSIIKQTISNINPIKAAIEIVSTNKESSNNINYLIASSVKEFLTGIKTDLQNPTPIQRVEPPKDTSPSRVTAIKPEDTLSPEERLDIDQFLESFMNILPLEGNSSGNLRDILNQPIIGKEGEGFLARTLTSVLKSKIQGIVASLSGQLLLSQDEQSSAYKLLRDNLSQVNKLFKPSATTYVAQSDDSCKQVVDEAKKLLKDVIRLSLDKQLQKSPIEKTNIEINEQTQLILSNHKKTIETLSQNLDKLTEKAFDLKSEKDLYHLEDNINLILLEIEKAAYIMKDDLEDALKFKSLSPQLRSKIKETTDQEIQNLQSMLDKISAIKSALPSLRDQLYNQHMFNQITPTKETSNSDEILPGIKKEELNKIFDALETTLHSEQKDAIKTCRTDTSSISDLNTELRAKDQLKAILESTAQGFLELERLNKQIIARPQPEKVKQYQSLIGTIETLNKELLGSKDIPTLELNLSKILGTIEILDQEIEKFSQFLPESEQTAFKDSLTVLKGIHQDFKTLLDEQPTPVAIETFKEILKGKRQTSWKDYNKNISLLNQSLNSVEKNNEKDQKEINGLILQLQNRIQTFSAQLPSDIPQEKRQNINNCIDIVRQKLLNYSVINNEPNQNKGDFNRNQRSLINALESAMIVDQTRQKNSEEIFDATKQKSALEAQLKSRLQELKLIKDQELSTLNVDIRQNMHDINTLGQDTLTKEKTLHPEDPHSVYLGLGPVIQWSAQSHFESSLNRFSEKTLDFALNPKHREILLSIIAKKFTSS
jgi:hypothetical protein